MLSNSTPATVVVAIAFAASAFAAAPAPGSVRKLLIEHPRDQKAIPGRVLSDNGATDLADYGRARVVSVPEAAAGRLSDRLAVLGFEVRELGDQIQTPRRTLNAGVESPQLSAMERGLFLLQYVAPPTAAWQQELRSSGAVRVENLPERTVIVSATREQMSTPSRSEE